MPVRRRTDPDDLLACRRALKQTFTLRCEHGFINTHSLTENGEWFICSDQASFSSLCRECAGRKCDACNHSGLSINETMPEGWRWHFSQGSERVEWSLAFHP